MPAYSPFGRAAIDQLRCWFLDSLLPLWSINGVDRHCGGFFEKLHHNLQPTFDNRRTRLVSRQIYLFSTGSLLGWEGPCESLINHGLEYLLKYLVTPDGQIRASCFPNGLIADESQYLYDVAFVLVALAKVAECFPNLGEYETLARKIASRLLCSFQNTLGGYIDEGQPNILRANPHMHLFEAFLAWAELQDSDREFWILLANACGRLALERMLLPGQALLPELFTSDWRPIRHEQGLLIEPGHQFEWSWLLERWSRLAGVPEALDAAARLCRNAEQYGVDPKRNVVFESINDVMEPIDLTARLWQQTERIKAWHTQAHLCGDVVAHQRRDQALLSLQNFLSGPRPGLWYDTMDPLGNFIAEPVKASSGYHIACAIEALVKTQPDCN